MCVAKGGSEEEEGERGGEGKRGRERKLGERELAWRAREKKLMNRGEGRQNGSISLRGEVEKGEKRCGGKRGKNCREREKVIRKIDGED